MAIDSPSYAWHKNRRVMKKYMPLPNTENYQRKYNSNKKLKKELNETEIIGIKLKNHKSIPFKRIYCCQYEGINIENGNKCYLQLYVSYGEEQDNPFLLFREGEDATLEVVGIIDKNKLTWQDIEEKVTSSDLVTSLSKSKPSVCSLTDEGINFEICSRVHNYIFSNEESAEDYSFDTDNSVEQEEFDFYEYSRNSVGRTEYIYSEGTDPHKTAYSRLPNGINDDSFKKFKVSAASEKKFISTTEEEFTAATDEDVTDYTYFEGNGINEDSAGEVIREGSFEVKRIDKDFEKEVIEEAPFKVRSNDENAGKIVKRSAFLEDKAIDKVAEKEVIENVSLKGKGIDKDDGNEAVGYAPFEYKYIDKNVKEKVMTDATLLNYNNGSDQNESDSSEYDDYSEPDVFDWFDQPKRACNTRYVSVDKQKPDTLPVETLRCMFYAKGTRTNKFFVALLNYDKNKVSVAVMRPKNFFYNEKTSPLEVRGTVEFIRH